MTSTALGALTLDGFSGELLTPESPAYDDARRVANGAIDRRPAFIARCRSAEDVAAALGFARRHDLVVAVRGGGHSLPGYSVCDGGLVVDLTRMRAVRVDAERRTAVVQPGVTWSELDAATQEHGLACPGGEISHTGVAGLTLGGGIGWLTRMHGLACDNLVAVELVTADGEVRRVDDDSDPELMWGLRGGGGNFGVVTSFVFRLHPVAPMLAGMAFYPGDRRAEALHVYQELASAAPRELSLEIVLVTAPPAPFVPEEVRGRPAVGLAGAYFGDPAEGEHALSPLRTALGRPVLDTFGVTPYCVLQQSADGSAPWGMKSYIKSDFLGPLDDAGIAGLVAGAKAMSNPQAHVLLRNLGGAMADVAPAATAFAHRDAAHLLTVVGAWQADDQSQGQVDWARSTWAATRHLARGTYVNHLEAEGTERIREAYAEDTWRRLTVLKARMDPENVFRHNQNVPPAGS